VTTKETTMTTPDWTVRVAGGDAPTALIVERADEAIVTDTDQAAVYQILNGQPEEPTDPNRPPGLSDGHCEITELHDPHVATWHGDDGVDFEYWCSGAAVAEALPAATEGSEG
jgi:hypothetical protein